MTNSIYSQFNQNGVNIQQIVRQFQHFKNSNNVNPQAEVENLLRTGKMTQAQFNQLQGIKQRIQHFFQ